MAPTYHAVHTVLTHPAYAGAYTFGRTRAHRSVDADGQLRTSRHRLPQDEWEVLIIDHHRGVHRLGYLPGQPDPDSRQHPPEGAPAGHTARRARAARCCRGWPPAGCVGASSRSTTTARPRPPPATTAPAPGTSSRAAARVTCVSVVPGSTPRSPGRFRPRCNRRRCRPAWPPPSSSRTATTPRWRSGAARSSKPATRPAAPSAYRAVDPDNRLVAPDWRPSGTPRCKPSPTPRPNSPAAKQHDRKP